MFLFTIYCFLIFGFLDKCLAIDYGPTYGKDYAGLDYNVTRWHTPDTEKANHYESAMKRCEKYCLNDPNCCTWCYVTPERGASDPERCCLKNGLPTEKDAATHWTGAAPRANSSQCTGDPPYPGPAYMHPKINYSPGCMHKSGWHDIAASITFKGKHHVFQGCPHDGGWLHSVSDDLVHWTEQGIHVHAIHETYEGIDSNDSPCSGFVTVDDDGIPCAGFRQCGSSHGLPGGNKWDVPLELRCAKNENLTEWGDPIYIFDFYYFRALPYDPVRPWRGSDNKWYATIATDNCNATTKKLPCLSGSANQLYSSDILHGKGANWKHVGVMFASNRTVLRHGAEGGDRYKEFTTPGYFGGLRGDPLGGKTKVFTDNNAGGYTMYWIGTQPIEGKEFVNDWSKDGTIGAFDYSSFAPNLQTGKIGFEAIKEDGWRVWGMARTLGGNPNQVATPNQRIVIHAWQGGGQASGMSIGRDLTLDENGLLLQQYVPELKILRIPSSHIHSKLLIPQNYQTPVAAKGQQLEIVCQFSGFYKGDVFGVRVLVGSDPDDYVAIGVNLTSSLLYIGDSDTRAGPMNYSNPYTANTVWMHAYVDHSIVTVIVNNRTAITKYVTPANATSDGVFLFASSSDIKADIHVWSLKDANNV